MRRQEKLDQQSILPVQIPSIPGLWDMHTGMINPILQSLSSWKKQVSEVNMPCRLQKRFLMHIIMNEMLHVLLKSIILISMTVL